MNTNSKHISVYRHALQINIAHATTFHIQDNHETKKPFISPCHSPRRVIEHGAARSSWRDFSLFLVFSLCRGKCVESLLLRQVQRREEEERDSHCKATEVRPTRGLSNLLAVTDKVGIIVKISMQNYVLCLDWNLLSGYYQVRSV